VVFSHTFIVIKRGLRPYLDYLIILALVGACYLLFFHKLGSIGLIGPDEPRYSAVAREMYLTGDYVTPRLYGEPWFEKPVLMYWIAAVGYMLFGVNEWGARFPSALSATITVFMVYWCGRRLWSRTVGFLSALLMASSIGFFAFARAASMDMPLTACLTMALVFFLFGYNAEEGSSLHSARVPEGTPRIFNRRYWFYAFYAALGLGALAKGPIAFALPAASLLLFAVFRGKWNEWKTWHIEGTAIAFLVALPWYIACTVVNGVEFLKIFFISHNFERFTTGVFGHQRPFYFYLPVLLLLTFPWTFVLISALRRRFGMNEQILLWWIIVPFVFFSLSGSKLPGYILPVVPPIAILCGKELWLPASRAFKVAVFIEAGLMAFIGVAFGFFGNMLHVDPHVSGTLIATITFVLAGLLCVIAIWLSPRFLAAFNVLTITAVVVVATNFVLPRFDRTDTMRPWDQALLDIVPADQVVLMYRPARWVEYGLQFYRYNKAKGVFNPQELLAAMSGQRVLCIAEDKNLDELTKLGGVDFEIVHTIGNQSAFWVWQTE
jgi:4-amino-4-deoxy-L-arabinose transferase-like glycosyltransferase